MKVTGAKILLTGATGGIGHALARALHDRGGQLVLSGRRLDVLTPLADELGARAIAADLATRADVERLADAAAEVDILVANAALPASGHLLELSPAQIDAMLEVNLRAPIALTRALAPAMVQRERGHIVLISSLSGKAAAPASSVYSAAKFGLRGFAHGARADLRGNGVGVSVILPGFVRDAGMFADTGLKLPPGIGTSSPEQVADAAVKAIERNRGEVAVAPLGLRLGANLAAVAPDLSAFGQRLLGGAGVARRVSERQVGKRPDDR
ncbi:MAG TPA: SDR family NAD(P)-dependent oxidoreductase [Solirubrobacteraceae bacterium]|jgi:short-subunit dehydrogenase|nr:SDR family NAD(P)-dependent oxidoreductase [Solirubrobacteraceae bacterium]